MIINSPKELKFDHKAVCIDATSIAIEYLGVPIVNTSMLGAFAAASGVLSLEAIEKAAKEQLLRKYSKEKQTANIDAIRKTYEEVKKCL